MKILDWLRVTKRPKAGAPKSGGSSTLPGIKSSARPVSPKWHRLEQALTIDPTCCVAWLSVVDVPVAAGAVPLRQGARSSSWPECHLDRMSHRRRPRDPIRTDELRQPGSRLVPHDQLHRRFYPDILSEAGSRADRPDRAIVQPLIW